MAFRERLQEHAVGIRPAESLVPFVPRGAAALAGLVRDGGRLATTQGTADVEGLATRAVTATNVAASATPEKLASLAALAASGDLVVQIQQSFVLADIAAALAAFSAGTMGKIVVLP